MQAVALKAEGATAPSGAAAVVGAASAAGASDEEEDEELDMSNVDAMMAEEDDELL